MNVNDQRERQDILEDLYLGYQTKEEEKEVYLDTKQVVFFRENLYLEKEDSKYLDILYRIRDGKTILEGIKQK